MNYTSKLKKRAALILAVFLLILTGKARSQSASKNYAIDTTSVSTSIMRQGLYSPRYYTNTPSFNLLPAQNGKSSGWFIGPVFRQPEVINKPGYSVPLYIEHTDNYLNTKSYYSNIGYQKTYY